MVTHLYHGTAGLGLHEEDLADIAVLTHQVEQSVTVDLSHGKVVDHHNTGSLVLPPSPQARPSTHHVHAPHTREEITTTNTPTSSTSSSSSSRTHVHHVGLVQYDGSNSWDRG